jgi:hypothetical protein
MLPERNRVGVLVLRHVYVHVHVHVRVCVLRLCVCACVRVFAVSLATFHSLTQMCTSACQQVGSLARISSSLWGYRGEGRGRQGTMMR